MKKLVLTICLVVVILFLAFGCEPKLKESEKKDSDSSSGSGFGFEVDKPQVAKVSGSWWREAEGKKIFQEYEKHFYPAHKLTPNERRDYARSQFENFTIQNEVFGQYIDGCSGWVECTANHQPGCKVCKKR